MYFFYILLLQTWIGFYCSVIKKDQTQISTRKEVVKSGKPCQFCILELNAHNLYIGGLDARG